MKEGVKFVFEWFGMLGLVLISGGFLTLAILISIRVGSVILDAKTAELAATMARACSEGAS